jgi:hypothetical protein
MTATRAGIQTTHPGTPIRGKKVLRHEIHPHMFRRFRKFQMRKAGVTDVALLEHMMGQRDRGLLHGGTYDVFDPDYNDPRARRSSWSVSGILAGPRGVE